MRTIDIVNYNPDFENDKNNIENIINQCKYFKENIHKINYKPYKHFLDKLNKFIVLITSNFKKELEEYRIENNFYNDNKEDEDNISIASVSEYDEDEFNNQVSKDIYSYEKEKILEFENRQKLVYNTFNNLYDIEIE